MNYFVQRGDRWMVKMLTHGILLHACICIASIAGLILLPVIASDFFKDVEITNRVHSEAKIVEYPLVQTGDEGQVLGTSLYRCYLKKGDFAVSYLRPSSPAGLSVLRMYSHPILDQRFPSFVEVPADPTWSNVFHSVTGQSLQASVTGLVLAAVLTPLGVYVSIRLYLLIKRGYRRR